MIVSEWASRTLTLRWRVPSERNTSGTTRCAKVAWTATAQTRCPVQRVQRGGSVLEEVDGALGVGQKGIAGRRQCRAPGAAVEEARPDLTLQPRHAIADGGLGHEQGARRPAKASFSDDGQERRHIVCLYGHKQIL